MIFQGQPLQSTLETDTEKNLPPFLGVSAIREQKGPDVSREGENLLISAAAACRRSFRDSVLANSSRSGNSVAVPKRASSSSQTAITAAAVGSRRDFLAAVPSNVDHVHMVPLRQGILAGASNRVHNQ
jgi:hypothetical protein